MWSSNFVAFELVVCVQMEAAPLRFVRHVASRKQTEGESWIDRDKASCLRANFSQTRTRASRSRQINEN